MSPISSSSDLSDPAHAGTSISGRALASVMPELLAMDEKRLVSVNVDVPAATRVVIGAARHYRALRPEMVELFGEEKASAVERAQLLAWAAANAHAIHLAADTGPDLVSLGASLGEVRAALVAEVSSLGARKLVTPRELGKLRGGRGYASLAFDVLQLVSFLDQRWADIESATGYRMEDLHRAEALANQLVIGVGIREQPERSPSADVRQRAFTLLAETYDQVRRMVGYVRWMDGDADEIAPSWHRGRNRTRKTRAEPMPATPV